ncbi:MAG: nucleotide exchange factor GrpE [Clostridiales bacterium]|nr:nucleotide exchange factor GrpE [Clostridiales bacterium]
MEDNKKKGKCLEEETENIQENDKVEVQDVKELLLENETLKKQVEEFKDKWMRNVAEFDNYKKRTAMQWAEAFNEGIASVIIKILPVGDNLDWALSLGLDQKTEEGIIKIRNKFDETLKSLEIEEINPVGEVFDPQIAEAVMQVPASDGEQVDTVKQVFQKGYRKKDKIIRYATVSVIK